MEEFLEPQYKSEATISKGIFGVYLVEFKYVDRRRISPIIFGVENGIANLIERNIKEEYKTLKYSFKRPDLEGKDLSAVLTVTSPEKVKIKILTDNKRIELEINSNSNGDNKGLTESLKKTLNSLIGDYKIVRLIDDVNKKVYRLAKVKELEVCYSVID